MNKTIIVVFTLATMLGLVLTNSVPANAILHPVCPPTPTPPPLVYDPNTNTCVTQCPDGYDVTTGECVLTPANATISLGKDIQNLIDKSILSAKDGGKLTTTLDKILKAIDSGDTTTSCDQLSKVIRDTQKLIDNGSLDSTTGQQIIDSVNAIKTSIGC